MTSNINIDSNKKARTHTINPNLALICKEIIIISRTQIHKYKHEMDSV